MSDTSDYLVQPGRFWNSDGAVGPCAPPVCRLTESTAAWDNAPEWMRDIMPLSPAELQYIHEQMARTDSDFIEPSPPGLFREPRPKVVVMKVQGKREEELYNDMITTENGNPEQLVGKAFADITRNVTIIQMLDPQKRAEYFDREIESRWLECRQELIKALAIA